MSKEVMIGAVSSLRAVVAQVEALEKGLKALGRANLFDGKLRPLLKDYVACAAQLDETVNNAIKARKEADACFDQVVVIKETYRAAAKRAERTDPGMATALNRFMSRVTPETVKNQTVRKAWQAFKKDHPSFVAARQKGADFGPTLDAYAKQANVVDVLEKKTEGLRPELIKSYLKFMACARTYEGIFEREEINPRLPAAFRKMLGEVTKEHNGMLGDLQAAA